jgi:hypothetical protein
MEFIVSFVISSARTSATNDHQLEHGNITHDTVFWRIKASSGWIQHDRFSWATIRKIEMKWLVLLLCFRNATGWNLGRLVTFSLHSLTFEVEVTLRLTVSQSVSQYVLVSGTPLGPMTKFFLCRTIALLLGRPLWREDWSVICSVICQWSESRRTHKHTFLSHLRLLGPFPSPLTTLRDYGGSILTRLHVGTLTLWFCFADITCRPYLTGNIQSLLYEAQPVNDVWRQISLFIVRTTQNILIYSKG